MAWRRPGDKPLSEPMMVSIPTQICVTRPQWVDAGDLIWFTVTSTSIMTCHFTEGPGEIAKQFQYIYASIHQYMDLGLNSIRQKVSNTLCCDDWRRWVAVRFITTFIIKKVSSQNGKKNDRDLAIPDALLNYLCKSLALMNHSLMQKDDPIIWKCFDGMEFVDWQWDFSPSANKYQLRQH